MLCLGDIAELWALRDESKAVQVVKHDYTPRYPRKYLGTPMEAANEPYEKKNWSSVMLINNSWWGGMPENDAKTLHRFSWLPDERIGELPREWNFLDDEDNQCHPIKAKVVHFTNGSPFFPHYSGSTFAGLWRGEYNDMLGMR